MVGRLVVRAEGGRGPLLDYSGGKNRPSPTIIGDYCVHEDSRGPYY